MPSLFHVHVAIQNLQILILCVWFSFSFQPGAPKFPPKAFIIDLIHDPGHLMRADSPEAVSYQQI